MWVNVEHVKDADNNKELGTDFTTNMTWVGAIVANQVCWLEILKLYGYFMPAFVPKMSLEVNTRNKDYC